MRTLSDITDAARRGEAVTEEELRLAVCAYDVFIAPSNDPDNPEAVAWHKAFINVD